MKKSALILLLSTLAFAFPFVGATAQKFDFGLKAGMNIANLKISMGGLSATSDDLFSFHGGLYGVLWTSERLAIQPEFIYSAQGGASSGGGGNFDLGYLTIPVMLRYDFTPGVSIQAGPQVGFLMNASTDGTDVKSVMASPDFGLAFGLGVDRPSGISFTFRYVIGLTNTLTDEFNSIISGFGIPGITMTNQVMQFSLGYRLSKK